MYMVINIVYFRYAYKYTNIAFYRNLLYLAYHGIRTTADVSSFYTPNYSSQIN